MAYNPNSSEQMYHNVVLEPAEIEVLTRLEQIIGKSIPLVEKITLYKVGFVVENKSIVQLGLFEGKFLELPESIGNLTNLQVLKLYDNQLTSLPESFSKLINLKFIDLDRKPIIQIMKVIESHSPIYEKLWETAELRLDDYEFQKIDPFKRPASVKKRQKSKINHEFYLNIANSLGRALYATLLGALLAISLQDLLPQTQTLVPFISLFILFGLIFLGTVYFAYRQEIHVRKITSDFIVKELKALRLKTKEFSSRLETRDLQLENELATKRYETIRGFTTNFIITGLTTLIFAIFTTNQLLDSDFQALLYWILAFLLIALPVLYYTKIALNRLVERHQQFLYYAVTNHDQKIQPRDGKRVQSVERKEN